MLKQQRQQTEVGNDMENEYTRYCEAISLEGTSHDIAYNGKSFQEEGDT